MGIFSRIFGQVDDSESIPDIQFGRFSDSYKKEFKYDAWDKAMVCFEEERYLDCFEYFFEYLKDDIQENIKIQKGEDKLSFTFFQGSKRIEGWADQTKFRAEAKIAIAEKLHIGFMRRLLEDNFQLKYARYALDKANTITLIFDTYASDASPYKLYAALKELATQADKKDDILVSEFESLKAINTGHIRIASNEEKDIKYGFMQSQIKSVLDTLNEGSLNIDQFPGGASYLLLDLAFRLDYLIKPEGIVMDGLEKVNRIFFNSKDLSPLRKNEEIIKVFQDITSISKSDFGIEIYDVIATFGVTMPTGHERFLDLVQNEIGAIDWYAENNHFIYAEAIAGYIAGYSLFNFSLPEPDKELLHLLFQIRSNEYFNNLGFKQVFVKDGKIQSNAVGRCIQSISKKYKDTYPLMEINIKNLHFDRLSTFTKSFIIMVAQMNLSRSKI